MSTSSSTHASWNQSAYPSPTSSSSSSRQPSKSTSIREHVQVMVRCRPPRSQKELSEEPCWAINTEGGSIGLARPSNIAAFNYDNVVKGVNNEQVYNSGIYNLVRSSMVGYNGTVFAYGQTASGKTYTMMGTEAEPGVIPRAIHQVFSFIEEDTAGREYMLRVSYMEIYNEKIKDLLNSENKSPEIIEDKKKGVSVRNLKEVTVKTAQEVMNYIKDGEGNRHISATDYNEHSSRSHTIFQLVIESCSRGVPSRGVRVSQLNLIDLAGSEKVATDLERRKEGGYINKSLLTLGNVISKLTSDEPASHIPYRDSKLTRILQASLSGNARIAIICTINPTLSSKDESLNTLRFAQRAKLIKTAAKMTRVLDNSELENCLLKIAELQIKVQEKNNLEAETRQRLKSLLGLILTSSKNDQDQLIDQSEVFSQFANLSADDLSKETTMRDVVARCEEGFAAQILAHEIQMDKMTLHVKAMQADMKIMREVLSERDALIADLRAKPKTVETSTQTHPTPASHSATQTPPMSDLTPAIVQSVQHISEAITTGLTPPSQREPTLDDSQVDISRAVSCVFQNVVASTVLNKPRDVDTPKNTITQALQNAIHTSLPVTPDFIPIKEAVLFLQFGNPFPLTHAVGIIEEEEFVPELLEEYVSVEKEDCFELQDTPASVSEEVVECLDVRECVNYAMTEEEQVPDYEEESAPDYVAMEEDEVPDYATDEEEKMLHLALYSKEKEACFWEDRNPVCNSSDDSDAESTTADNQSCDVIVTKATTNDDDGYVAYSKSINQVLPFSILINRWIVLCVALYIVFYQTI
ncbi:hypothetical protein INT47_007920 [Mucor saturninus]|uniref:Kinesin-like protein n=1 Tax=Mucor saturninus TaxID=64648 RepID=A0A8H7QMB7_9FUNG|nr:hypothetical protein INT47_007920 [Mucor saturninus]